MQAFNYQLQQSHLLYYSGFYVCWASLQFLFLRITYNLAFPSISSTSIRTLLSLYVDYLHFNPQLCYFMELKIATHIQTRQSLMHINSKSNSLRQKIHSLSALGKKRTHQEYCAELCPLAQRATRISPPSWQGEMHIVYLLSL